MVTLYRLDRNDVYATATKVPLSWLQNTAPADHLDRSSPRLVHDAARSCAER
jgi:hypothetical protein